MTGSTLSYGDKSPDGQGMTAIIRGHLRNGEFVDQQQIFKADPSLYRPGGQRFGSRLIFDNQGHLFFSIGDRAAPGDEQELSRPNGKIYRVNEDGSVPPDNPFVNRAGAIKAIWSYGHRNPQGLSFSPVTGELWEAEHGPRGGDELNIIEPGHNYGWPVITYGMNYDGTPITSHTAQAGMDQPITNWVPSIATSPITFYTGNRFPAWKNSLFLGALAAQELRRITVEGRQGDQPGNPVQRNRSSPRSRKFSGRLSVRCPQPTRSHRPPGTRRLNSLGETDAREPRAHSSPLRIAY